MIFDPFDASIRGNIVQTDHVVSAHGGVPFPWLCRFSRIQVSRDSGRQPSLIVRNILYVIHDFTAPDPNLPLALVQRLDRRTEPPIINQSINKCTVRRHI